MKAKQCEGLKLYCSEKLKECEGYLPSRYSKEVLEIARRKGLNVSRQFIIDVRTGRKYDKVVVDILVELATENRIAIWGTTEAC
ncbi:MAG: hypothetical protein JKY54_13055 [Flavobacteriales bacterium]|nr:hypothetical protein [Flavobacteriales bacterium]